MWLCSRDTSKECKGYRDCTVCTLNTIKAEIEHVKDNPIFGMVSNDTMLEVILEIIDKYAERSE